MILLGWFALVLISVLYIAWDVFTKTPENTVNVGPGERYDVIWEAREPGKWLIHCHINHHTTNDNVETEGGGGLMMIIDVRP